MCSHAAADPNHMGALVVVVRRTALTHDAEVLEPRHATEDGVAVFAN